MMEFFALTSLHSKLFVGPLAFGDTTASQLIKGCSSTIYWASAGSDLAFDGALLSLYFAMEYGLTGKTVYPRWMRKSTILERGFSSPSFGLVLCIA